MQTTTLSNQIKAGLVEMAKLTTAPLPDAPYNGPISIARENAEGKLEVLTEHTSDSVRVFGNLKSAKKWVKRNIASPAERRKMVFVRALRS